MKLIAAYQRRCIYWAINVIVLTWIRNYHTFEISFKITVTFNFYSPRKEYIFFNALTIVSDYAELWGLCVALLLAYNH